jgi:hypothetical protein
MLEADAATGAGEVSDVVVEATGAGLVIGVEPVAKAGNHILADLATDTRLDLVALEIQSQRQASGGIVVEIV